MKLFVASLFHILFFIHNFYGTKKELDHFLMHQILLMTRDFPYMNYTVHSPYSDPSIHVIF